MRYLPTQSGGADITSRALFIDGQKTIQFRIMLMNVIRNMKYTLSVDVKVTY